jgi:hypothetical protein
MIFIISEGSQPFLLPASVSGQIIDQYSVRKREYIATLTNEDFYKQKLDVSMTTGGNCNYDI